MSELTLPDKVVAIDEALERARVGHAFGGAIALAYYAEPRATIDIDVNVFVEATEHARVSDALSALGVDAVIDPRRVESDGQARIRWGATPVDVFFAHDPLHDAMARASRRVPFGVDTIPVLGPEHLVVCKATFDRAKDWLDIEQVLVAVDDFDVAEVRRWLPRIVGTEDPRNRRFDDMARDLLAR